MFWNVRGKNAISVISRGHNKLTRQYCVKSVECVSMTDMENNQCFFFVFFCLFFFFFKIPPARKDHIIYNVNDVIDAVQNGNSDFKMDSDTSDEEECGDACELKKENKKPNDHPSYVYVDVLTAKSS